MSKAMCSTCGDAHTSSLSKSQVKPMHKTPPASSPGWVTAPVYVFIHYDLGYIDLEQRSLQTLDNPFGPRVSPMS